MGDTLSHKITEKALYIQHLDRSRYDSTDLFRIIRILFYKDLTLITASAAVNFLAEDNIVHNFERHCVVRTIQPLSSPHEPQTT